MADRKLYCINWNDLDYAKKILADDVGHKPNIISMPDSSNGHIDTLDFAGIGQSAKEPLPDRRGG